MYGGIFLYPSDKKNTKGKLRVLYEVLPMAFIIENAGGKAIMGAEGNAIDAKAKLIHDKSSLICGSFDDVLDVENLY
jgi:fructose-1,6-bisphosphatase I